MTIIWIILILAVVVGALLISFPAPLKHDGRGINTLEVIDINGRKAWLSVRGVDASDPVLLFLHGGPGSANLALLRTQCPELEQHFVVVNWDQPGAGKSYDLNLDYSTLSIDQMVGDTHAMILYLKERFGVEKVYVMGFSWGTVPGLLVAHRYPQDVAAYFGISQELTTMEAERISLAYTLEHAREHGDTAAVAALEQIDPAYTSEDWLSQLMTERKYLLGYGGVYYQYNNYNHEVFSLLKAPEYSLLEFAFWPLGSARSLEFLWPEIQQLDLTREVTHLEVPVYFFEGRMDYNCPSELVEAWYQTLEAPAGKQLYWYDKAAHSILWDQPEAFSRDLLQALDHEEALKRKLERR